MNIKTIKIGDRFYKIKNTIRSIFIFEQITQRPFEIKTTLDNYIYFYSIILASNNEDVLSWDNFLDELDNDPNIIVELNKKLTENQEIESLLNPDSDNENEDKKKE